MQALSIHAGENAEQLFEYIKYRGERGKRVVVCSYSSPNAPESMKEQAMEFDHEFYVEMSNDNSVLLRNHDEPGGVGFLKCRLTDDGEHLEMFVLDNEYGSTYIGDVTGVR